MCCSRRSRRLRLPPAQFTSSPRPVVCTTDGRPLPADVWQRALGAKALAGGALAEPIFCTWDSIPRTTTWKVRRLELRRRLEVGQFPGPGG